MSAIGVETMWIASSMMRNGSGDAFACIKCRFESRNGSGLL